MFVPGIDRSGAHESLPSSRHRDRRRQRKPNSRHVPAPGLDPALGGNNRLHATCLHKWRRWHEPSAFLADPRHHEQTGITLAATWSIPYWVRHHKGHAQRNTLGCVPENPLRGLRWRRVIGNLQGGHRLAYRRDLGKSPNIALARLEPVPGKPGCHVAPRQWRAPAGL